MIEFMKKIVAQHLRKAADDIEDGSCGLNMNEIEHIMQAVMHVELKKSEAAELLGISTRTFDRRVSNGELPPGKHTIHHKELIWYKDEILGIN